MSVEPVEEDMAAASILISVPKKRFKRAVMTLPNSRKNLVREVLKSGKPGQAPGNLTATTSQPEAVRSIRQAR